MHVSSYVMKTEGEVDKIEETEDLERLETIALEQSQEHTGGTKPDKDDQYEQDNKKQRFAESNSTLITGTKRQMRALSNQRKSHLFLSERSKDNEFSQYNRILLVISSFQSDNTEPGIVHMLNPSIEAAVRESLIVFDHIEKDNPGLIVETGGTETTISYQLHKLVPFTIGLCREMLVTDNNSKGKRELGVQY